MPECYDELYGRELGELAANCGAEQMQAALELIASCYDDRTMGANGWCARLKSGAFYEAMAWKMAMSEARKIKICSGTDGGYQFQGIRCKQ